jgi:ATP-binding cassette subfamily B protein
VAHLLAALPGMFDELRFNADAFRLFRAHTPETRRQHYLETLLTREDHAKELRLYGTGPALLARHRSIFRHWFKQDRALSLRRAGYGLLLGVVSTLATGACLWWVTSSAMRGATSLGTLTMLFFVLRQAQVASSDLLAILSGMHEDQLYLEALQELLALPVPAPGTARSGTQPGSGIRFEGVWFTYPGAAEPALQDVTFTLRPGTRVSVVGANGAGKTTLLKLLTGLYRPTRGQVTLDGLPLEQWAPDALGARLAVMFQDFGRYQLLAGENIGIGHPDALDAPERWQLAARAALLEPLIQTLPSGYRTPLGQWFEGGRELSLGEWQRIALARTLTRTAADILVLDEPTASLDPAAEQLMLRELTRATAGRTAVLISHRATWQAPDAQVLLVRDGAACVRTEA